MLGAPPLPCRWPEISLPQSSLHCITIASSLSVPLGTQVAPAGRGWVSLIHCFKCVPVLVSWDCYNKGPQKLGGLKQWKCILSMVQEARHLKPGCRWAWFFLARGRISSMPTPAPGIAVIFGMSWPVAASPQSWPLSSQTLFHACPLLFL